MLSDLDLICLRAKVGDCILALRQHKADLPGLADDLPQLERVAAHLNQQWVQRYPRVAEELRHG